MRRIFVAAAVAACLAWVGSGRSDRAVAEAPPPKDWKGPVPPPKVEKPSPPVVMGERPGAAKPAVGHSGWHHEPPSYVHGWGYYPIPYPYGSIIFPPLILPPAAYYGPYVPRLSDGLAPLAPRVPQDNRHAADDDQDKEIKPGALRGTNAEAVALGRRFIGFGDAQFAAQKFGDALERYRKAASVAPGLADALFRQGFAQVAMGRYDRAAKAFKKGLELDPGWPRSGFLLARLYGENRAAQLAHVDAMAATALKQPDNGDLLFLVGLYLYFGGQPERATPFFQRAAQLSRGGTDHLTEFLKQGEDGLKDGN